MPNQRRNSRSALFRAGASRGNTAGPAPVAPPRVPVRRPAAPGGLAAPAAAALAAPVAGADRGGLHPLTDAAANARLHGYETRVREAFGRIVPVLKRISALQHEEGFEARAQSIANAELGFELPQRVLDDAWVSQLDLRSLYAWCVFKTYRRLCDEFFTADPLGGRDGDGFERFLQGCGFHLLDVTPCADGRLAHTVSYVLRLPHAAVRRKSSAGALFDVEDTVAKWVETELRRYREGVPNTADAPTRYLKTVVYHFSSTDPGHEGCAAHGSDDARAAAAGLERLRAFQQAVQNGFCCGASVDLLLIGQDTDTDAVRVHVPDRTGRIDLDRSLDARDVYAATRGLAAEAARARIAELVRASAPGTPEDGMVRLAARLIENNLSQIDYVRAFHNGAYTDVGHAERFIGAGIGFEEIQLRNLTYFAYLHTVEEATADLDVGIRIFTGLNVSHGLPVPIVVRFDYHGSIPGARERAVARTEQVTAAITARYPELVKAGLLHTLRMVRDCDGRGAGVEVIGCSLTPAASGGH